MGALRIRVLTPAGSTSFDISSVRIMGSDAGSLLNGLQDRTKVSRKAPRLPKSESKKRRDQSTIYLLANS
jgi:hypothetical protein